MKKNLGYSFRRSVVEQDMITSHLYITMIFSRPCATKRLDHETRRESYLYWVMFRCLLNLMIIQHQCQKI